MTAAPPPTPLAPPAADALIVVDMQRAFVTGDGAVSTAETLLAAVEGMLDRARAAGTLVVLVQNDGPPGEPDAVGTPGWELGVSRADGDVVLRKPHDDAFRDTELETILRQHGVTTIVVCGVFSEMCVAATARGALVRRFGVVVPHDAHASGPAPAWDGVADEVPAETVSRVAEWSLGDQVVRIPRAADAAFARSR